MARYTPPRSSGSTVSAAPPAPRNEAAAVGAALAEALAGGRDAPGAADAAAVGAALAEALAADMPAQITTDRAVNDALMQALQGIAGLN